MESLLWFRFYVPQFSVIYQYTECSSGSSGYCYILYCFTDSRRVSVRDIFAALQDQEVDCLQQVVNAIQTFHANANHSQLKHAETRDRSAPRIGKLQEVVTTAIQTFHANVTHSKLKHANTRDRSAPRIGK